MKIRAAVAAFAMLPTAGLAIAAGEAGETCDDLGDGVLACEVAGYFECETALAGQVKDPLTPTDLVPDFPETSFTAGGGCGMQEFLSLSGTSTTSIYDFASVGRMEGNVDTMTVELHSIYAAAQRAGGDVPLSVRLTLNNLSPSGYEPLEAAGTGDVTDSPKAFDILVTPEVSSTGISESLVFTITDLHEVFGDQLNKPGTGISKDRDLRARQNVGVTVSWDQFDYAGAWVWGASEVPGGVTFNGELRGTIISAKDLAPAEG